MPYRIVKRGAKFVVQKKDGSKSFGEHDTKEGADRQMAALYANELKAASMRALHLIGATGQPRVEWYDGREHLVVPVVALIGDNLIHAVNAPEPEWVPASVLSAQGWDGRPLMLGHPTKDGRPVSANDPRVREAQGFGFMANTRMNGKRLGTEAWVDVVKLEKLGQAKMLEDIRAGKPIEVSVGALVQTRDKLGLHNGRKYSVEWATTAPDHLAFLPDSLGACSVEMGCGANRAAMRVCEDRLEDVMQSIIDPVTFKTLRDIPQSERDKMPASDFAGPGQSFPIRTQADVDAASHLVGKAANPDAVKKRIISIAKRKGFTIPEAWQTRSAMSLAKLKERVLTLFDTPEQAASEEAAELIAYQSMRTMMDAVGDQWDEASGLIDDLIADEEENPTETPGQEDAEEEVEDARCDAIRMICYSMITSLQNVVSVTYTLQQPESMPTEAPRYMEQFKALVGKAISAKNMATIQKAHDTSHEMHAHTVALGAQCNGMKLLSAGQDEAAPDLQEFARLSATDSNAVDNSEFRAAGCGCDGGDMTNEQWINETEKHGVSAEQVKGLAMLLDKDGKSAVIDGLRTLAAKSPADSIIQAKAAADAALAGHAHGLNAKDQAEAAAAKKKAEEDAAAAADKGGDKKMKAAQAAGFKTVEEHERAVFYEKNPEIKSLVDRQKQQEADRKLELVASLKACGALTEEQLTAKSLNDLETLAAFAQLPKPDYSGRGAAVRAAEGSIDPPNPYSEEALKRHREQTVAH